MIITGHLHANIFTHSQSKIEILWLISSKAGYLNPKSVILWFYHRNWALNFWIGDRTVSSFSTKWSFFILGWIFSTDKVSHTFLAANNLELSVVRSNVMGYIRIGRANVKIVSSKHKNVTASLKIILLNKSELLLIYFDGSRRFLSIFHHWVRIWQWKTSRGTFISSFLGK